MGIRLLIILMLIIAAFLVYSYMTAPIMDETDDNYYISFKEEDNENK